MMQFIVYNGPEKLHLQVVKGLLQMQVANYV